MILVPDQTQKRVYERKSHRTDAKGKTLMFAHGFNIHFGQVSPPQDVDVADDRAEGPGPHRARHVQGQIGVPALLAVQQDATGQAKSGLAYGGALGGTRRGAGDDLQGRDRDGSVR